MRIQNDLFDVGADLCTPVSDGPAFEPLRVIETQITYLEEQIDKYNESLKQLRSLFYLWGRRPPPYCMLRGLLPDAQSVARGQRSTLLVGC